MYVIGIFFVLFGVFFIIASLKEWDWFIKFMSLNKRIKRENMNVYGALSGLFLIGMGLLTIIFETI
jgi:uncharacterized membrane protein YidH (DUF202 family)